MNNSTELSEGQGVIMGIDLSNHVEESKHLPEVLPIRLKGYLEKNKITNKAAGTAIGVHGSTIGRWCSGGQKINKTHIPAIIKFLDSESVINSDTDIVDAPEVEQVVCSVFEAPVTNNKKQRSVSFPEIYGLLTGEPEGIPDNSAASKADHGAYFLRGLSEGERNDQNLGPCYLLPIDIDEPIDDLPLPTPKDITDTLADITHAVHSTATPGRSRIVLFVDQYDKKDTSKLTLAAYQLCRSRGLNFSYAGESEKKSQPWFLPQTTDFDAHQAYGNMEGIKFNVDMVADLPDPDKQETALEMDDHQSTTNHNPVRDFIAALKSGTIHQAALKYAGWRIKTTDLSMGQVFVELDAFINGICTDKTKIKRWYNSERADLEKWFQEKQQPQDWLDPEPIESELSPVPPLTKDLLPYSIKEWVFDVADRMKVPPDYVAVAVLVVASSLIGTSCRIKPKENDDWTVTPNLWGAVIGHPSDGKSPSLEEVLHNGISRLEKEAGKIYSEQKQVHEIDDLVQSETRKIEEKKLKEAIKQDADIEEFKGNLIGMIEEDPPKKRRYRTNNASVEKLGEILSDNPRGILVYRDELVGAFNKWDENGDRPFFLESWSGKSSFIDDKIGRGTTEVEKLCLSILGTIQPDRITSYLIGAINGFDNDGFVQRFQMMVFPDRVPWSYSDRKPNIAAKEKTFDILHRLAHGHFYRENSEEEYSLFSFDSDAQELFKKWFIDLHENKILGTDDHPVLTEHFGKYRSLMPSLALIFHLMKISPWANEVEVNGTPSFQFEESSTIVSVGSVGMAIGWCEFLESHARRIYGMATSAGVRAAAILSEKIKNKKLSDGFTRRIISQKGWKLLSDNSIIDDAIEILIDRNWLKAQPHKDGAKKGGRPALTGYDINPKIF